MSVCNHRSICWCIHSEHNKSPGLSMCNSKSVYWGIHSKHNKSGYSHASTSSSVEHPSEPSGVFTCSYHSLCRSIHLNSTMFTCNPHIPLEASIWTSQKILKLFLDPYCDFSTCFMIFQLVGSRQNVSREPMQSWFVCRRRCHCCCHLWALLLTTCLAK